MSEARFKNMWSFMANSNYANNDIGSGMKCAICTGILINAHNSVCGCRYCYKCVKTYLKGKNKFCPGNTDDCRQEELDLGRNIYPDHPVNQKISKLIVACRYECEFRCELINMEDHEKACQSHPVNCPYTDVGCGETRLVADRISEHLAGEHESHARLLMDCINKLQMEIIGSMKRSEDRERQTNETMDQIREEMANLRNENTSLRMEIEKSRAQGQAQAHEIDLLVEKLDEMERHARQEKDELRMNIDEIRDKQTRERGDVEKRVREVEINAEMQKLGEFIWGVNHWSAKMENARKGSCTQIFSDEFYSHHNGYKMCLSIDPDGYGKAKGTHLSVWFHLMRGPFDNILLWPFKRAVTLSLIDQQTRANHVSLTFIFNDYPDSVAWNKPTADKNEGFGAHKLIELAKLTSNPNLCQDDRIFIRCTVKQ